MQSLDPISKTISQHRTTFLSNIPNGLVWDCWSFRENLSRILGPKRCPMLKDNENALYNFAPQLLRPTPRRYVSKKVHWWALHFSWLNFSMERTPGAKHCCSGFSTRSYGGFLSHKAVFWSTAALFRGFIDSEICNSPCTCSPRKHWTTEEEHATCCGNYQLTGRVHDS